MAKTEHSFLTEDKKQIAFYKHNAERNLKGIVIIVHGMAEHGQRYDDFAGFLNENGFTVYTYDQRGHGKTAGTVENLGFFAEKNGWNKVVNDLNVLIQLSKTENPGQPLFILGHSMGSFITRTFIAQSNENLSGVILSGTTGSAGLLGKVGVFLTNVIMLFKPKNSLSPLMDKLSFGEFNKAFKPNRTPFDWLSRDNEQVDKYVNDPFCGTIFSVGFFNDMMKGLEYVNKKENVLKIPSKLPVYLFSGDKDPVSKGGKQVQEVFNLYKNAGLTDLTIKLYPEGRHEMLNEVNRAEVYNDVLTWLNLKLSI